MQKTRKKKPLLRWFKFISIGILALLFLIPPTCMVGWQFVAATLNNQAIIPFVETFKQVEHPEDTDSLGFHYAIGVFTGNGNHCDFLATEARTFTGDKKQIEKFYKGMEITGTDKQKVAVDLLFVGSSHSESWPISSMLPQWYEDMRAQAQSKPIYFVLAMQYNEWAGFDLRCH